MVGIWDANVINDFQCDLADLIRTSLPLLTPTVAALAGTNVSFRAILAEAGAVHPARLIAVELGRRDRAQIDPESDEEHQSGKQGVPAREHRLLLRSHRVEHVEEPGERLGHAEGRQDQGRVHVQSLAGVELARGLVDVLAARRQELWIFFAKNTIAKNAATSHD